ncbi:MAG: VCBS repeat-containing protein [Oscillochloridaceae bacterium]|nr:VCBS repeat-containing protein [Chloroflexaceae bacterium]MDW8391713.1 VCBS repeat-containing protein [Oscillochloridaceae bacterium]
MAVTSRELAGRLPAAPRRPGLGVAYVLTFLLAALAVHVLVGAVVERARIALDDLRYGRPRTAHVTGYVGHGAEGAGRPTHIVAMNLDRQVVVLELPGSDPQQARSLPGPYLFGSRQDLEPVVLSLLDMDGDGLNDLVLTVSNERVVYLNREGAFRLPTAEEQALLAQEQLP